MKPKVGFSKISKLGLPLARLIRERTRDTNNIRNKRDDATTGSTDIKRIIREWSKHLYANTFDN